MARFARSGRRFRNATLRYTLRAVALCAAAALLYAGWLAWSIGREFEGRRWDLPAKVYAAPLELYAGRALAPEDLVGELKRLGYREDPRLPGPGTYRVGLDRVEIATRGFDYAGDIEPARFISLAFTKGRIDDIRDERGEDAAIARLDPLLIGSLFPAHGEDRLIVAPDETPPLLPAALIAIEDRRFAEHHGVDPLAMLRAAFVNLSAGEIKQGASTLTQQLVRSYFLSNERTWTRKLHEAFMALALELRYDKDDLMQAYINEIYLGQDGDRAVHGFGLASQFYFGKPLHELDLAEVALLVAVVRGPSYYDPRRHPERVRQRRDLVLKLMADRGIVKQEDARAAARRPLGVASRPSGAYFPAYLDFVRRTLRRDYRDQDLTEAGLRIYTSLDPRAQEQAEHALERELARLDRQHKRPEPLEGALVVTTPQSGDVIAIVGGRNVGYDGFDRALDAHRSMGSLVKPFIYLTALESGHYNAATVVQDAPIDVALAKDKHWRPENFTHQTYGPVPVVPARAGPPNHATVGVGLDVGLPKVADPLQRFGLPQPPLPVPAMLLR